MTENTIEKKTIQVLECSAELLEQPGKWIRGTLKRGSGPTAQFCAVGAVREVVRRLKIPESLTIQTRAEHELNRTVAEGRSSFGGIIPYNDYGARNAKTIVNVMRKTAKRLKEKKKIG